MSLGQSKYLMIKTIFNMDFNMFQYLIGGMELPKRKTALRKVYKGLRGIHLRI